MIGAAFPFQLVLGNQNVFLPKWRVCAKGAATTVCKHFFPTELRNGQEGGKITSRMWVAW
jgi:hypothetical protein